MSTDEPFVPPMPEVIEPVPLPTISIADILAATESVRNTEEAHRDALNGLALLSYDELKSTLVRWALAGFPSAYVLRELVIAPPPICSDGVSRNLSEYILYVSGKTIQELVAPIQERIPDFVVSYTNTGTGIAVVVSKP